ncbi:MAG: NAD(P)-dependent alcohol dehydrogenase [Rhizobiales bacterium]|nr:NAD(P)-dependent alcohol dehydrogenase [Hyphomicrobiales bacterium]
MKAVLCRKYGPPEVLSLEDIPKPQPQANEVLIKTRAATVFAGDCELRAFRISATWWLPVRLMVGITRPRQPILGQELAGEVEAVGSDVTKFAPGDKVFAATGLPTGSYAQYTCLPQDGPIAPLPSSMSFEEAATVPIGGLNALHFIRRAQLQPGERILIIGAGSSIGTFAVQLAKNDGAMVSAVDHTAKLDHLRAIGADNVIDYTSEDFTQLGKTYDVILDIAGKSDYGASLKVLASEGRYLLANPTAWPMLRGLWTSWTSARHVIFALAKEKAEDLVHLKHLIEQGKLKTVIDRRYPLEEIVQAHLYVDSGQKKGHVVLIVAHAD